MKILFFCSSLCGGAERMACLIAKKLAAQGDEIVFALSGKEDQVSGFLTPDVKIKMNKRAKFTDGLFVFMRNLIREERPDCVFGSQMPVNWRLVVAVLTSGRRPGIILRNDNYLYTQSFAQRLRLRITYPFAKTVIAQTDEMRDGLVKGLGLRPEKVLTISNPVDADFIGECLKEGSPYPETESGGTIFVAVGRVCEVKGRDLLIEAFNIVKTKMPDSVLYIVGGSAHDDFYNKIIRTVDDCGIKDSVRFVGFRTNPYVYMRYASCFVLPSRNEGLPNAMIEALYCGTPVAAFKCIPVIERIVESGKTGFLASGQDVNGLADAMINASKLGRIKSTYVGDTDGKITGVFKSGTEQMGETKTVSEK